MKIVCNYTALLLFVISFFSLLGCSDNKENELNPDNEAYIEFDKTSDLKPVVGSEGGTSTLIFTASDNWSVNVNTVTRAIDWLKVTPTQGGAGTVTLELTAQANDAYDERNAAIVLSCRNVKKTITLTQKQKNALLINSNKVEMHAFGGTFDAELQTNVDVSYEIDESAKGWITAATASSRGLSALTLRFQVAENPDKEERMAVITLKGGELTEKITVYQAGSEPAILLTKKEYTVSSDGETIQVELKSNISYDIVMPEVQWIKESPSRSASSYTYFFVVSPNETYDARYAEISFINKENNIEEKVKITQVQKDAILVANKEYKIAPEGEKLDFSVNTNVDFTVETSANWIQQINTRGLVERPLSFIISENMTENNREGEIIISYKDLKQIIKISQGSFLAQKHREALIAFYKATNGDNWYNNTNWCSDKPIYEWYGVNHCYGDWERIKKDYVVSLHLDGNNLKGKLPDETAILMDSCHRADAWSLGFNLSGNGISGAIPESVINHPRWSELGWDIIAQNPFLGNIIPPLDYKLRIANMNLTILNSNINTTIYDLLAKNEVTVVYNISGGEGCLETIDFTKERVNLHLDYHNKGLGTIYCFRFMDYVDPWMQKYVPENVPEDILFTTDFGHRGGAHYPHGNVYMYDKQGNLIYMSLRDYGIDESWYNNNVDSVLRARLGEPEDHPEFDMENFYTSTDFSRDGEVLTLQKASVGKGIDLVFLGEAFVDKDMEPRGYYEQMMKKGMEKLFSIEPYKSLRNRFNVYSVKVVSPNNLFLPGTETAIQENNDLCFEYASKIPGISKDRMMIGVIYGSNGFWRSYTSMYFDDGSFVAYLTKGVDDVLIHEVGGHGIAKLQDEYVEPGYEGISLPDEQKEDMDAIWQNYGWGANVDWRNDAKAVKWAHFLHDERYAGEGLGLYEGAYLYGYGAYRPTENSMMRYNDAPFNAPSREHIYKTVMQMSEGSSWSYNYEEFVQYDAINRNVSITRGLQKQPTEKQMDKWRKSHRPPVKMKGTWRDAVKSQKHITPPLRH